MENPNDKNIEKWVDEQIEGLHPAPDWAPNSERALGRLREMERRRSATGFRAGLLLFAAVCAVVLVFVGLPSMRARLDAAPNFELENVAGGTTSAAELKGKVTVIDVWATWCEPCIAEIPNFNKLHEAYQGKDVAIVGIAVESPHDDIVSKAKQFDMKYTVLVGNDDVVAGLGGLLGFPTTFVLTKDWKIYKSYMGLLWDKQERIKQDIDGLLAEPTE